MKRNFCTFSNINFKNISNDFSARKINLNDLDLNLLDDEIIFIAVHGKGGEDGHLQKALETKTLDLLDLDPMLQKCWDKHLSKNILMKMGLIPFSYYFEKSKTDIREISLAPTKKYFVKPISNGSSLE